MDAVKISNLSKSYGKNKVLKNIELNIASGEFFGLLGKNGAGKTTMINSMVGLSNFTDGKIEIFDKDVQREYRQTREFIGVSPQEFNVDIFATSRKIIDYVGGYFGMPKKERTKKINELVGEFNFSEHIDKPFQSLSGGLKRRVMLMKALVHDPMLIILDEPTAGVDIEQRHQLWKYLRKLQTDNKTIILTSHYLEEVEMLCSKVAILHNGKIVKILDRNEFRQNGQSLEKIYLDITKQ